MRQAIQVITLVSLASAAAPSLTNVNCTGEKCDDPVCKVATFNAAECAALLAAGDKLAAVFSYDTTSTCKDNETTPLTESFAIEWSDAPSKVTVTDVVATAATTAFPTDVFIDAGTACGKAASGNPALVSAKIATFSALTLDVTTVPGVVISGKSAIDPVIGVKVTYSAEYTTGGGETPPVGDETLTAISVTCPAECPDVCNTAEPTININACLALIPVQEQVTVIYHIDTTKSACAKVPNFGIPISLTGAIQSAEFVASSAIPSNAATSAQVSSDYTCDAAASGTLTAVVDGSKATFTFTEPLSVAKSDILGMTIGDLASGVSFASAKIVIEATEQGTLGAPPSSSATTVVAAGTLSAIAYLAIV